MARARRASTLLATLCATALAGCSSSPAPRAASPGVAAPGATAAATLPSPAPTATPPPLSRCPATPLAASGLAVLDRGGQPDDLAVTASGDLWVTDVGAGTLTRVRPGGAVLEVLRGFASPEGVAPLPDGDLLVAEQGHDRVLRIGVDGARTVSASLPPSNGALGVDGIAADIAGGRLLIPDSPHGTLLATSLGTGPAIETLARGLGRPVGVAAVGGSIYVVAENAAPGGLLRIKSGGGAADPVGSMAQLDDVVAVGGLLYVTDLAAHAVRAVDPATGAQRPIAAGLRQPQGLAVLADGRLAVADSDAGTVLALTPCG